jgi:hypothetical protein
MDPVMSMLQGVALVIMPHVIMTSHEEMSGQVPIFFCDTFPQLDVWKSLQHLLVT